MLISFKDLLNDAMSNSYVVGYFESWDIYSLEAVIEAAEEVGSPVIIGFGESVVDYKWYDSGGIEKLASLGLVAAHNAKVPVSLIFNEISTFEHAIRGIKSGFNVVMLDSAHLQFSDHLKLTTELVKVAHSVDVAVEAEVGVLPTNEENGTITEGKVTNPDDALEFVKKTKIDALAVSIGNVHLMKDDSANIDIKLLKEIHDIIDIPLVVHGGTGIPDNIIPELIKYGVAKINVGTILKKIFFGTLKKETNQGLDNNYNIHDIIGSKKSTDIMEKTKSKIKEEVKRRIKFYKPDIK